MIFDLSISGVLEEAYKKENEHDLTWYEERTSEFIKEEVLVLLEKMKKEHVDPLGFGLYYRSRHWNNETKWDDWQEIYPILKFKVNVDVNIKSAGLIE